MFGNKQQKQSRLARIEEIVRSSTDGVSQADLARRLQVSRGTICKDLGIIEEQTGAMLSEDESGKLRWFGRRQGRK